jgi:outer membrane receptor protein involved in Fe transport
MSIKVFSLLSIVLFTSLLSIGSAQSDQVVEEVLVSALRESTLPETDASVSRLDGALIESLPAQHFQDLLQQVPNLNLSGEGSRARYFQLRGIGELEQYEGAPNPSIGFIVDDIDLSGVGGISNLFDTGQIEILRGPQATRFGANAIAGLVYVQSAEPESESDFKAQLMSGNENTTAAGFAVGGSLSPLMTGRFSVQQHDSDGFYSNGPSGQNDSNGRNELLAHGKLRWALENDWELKLSVILADFNNGYDTWSPENGRSTYSDHPGRDEQKTTGASFKASGAINSDVDFVSITAQADSDILFSYDGEWGNHAYWAPYGYDYVYRDDRERSTLSQEFRLLSTPSSRIFGGKTDWLTGVYFQRLEESNLIASSGIYDDSADAPFSYCTPCLDSTRLNSAYQSSNIAIFGKLDTRINERTTLSAGIRLERWDAVYRDSFVDEIYGNPEQAVQNYFSPDEFLWGGDISLSYDLTEKATAYGLVSQGYKAGGFNPSLARAIGSGTSPASITFGSEKLLNFEAGIRGSWLRDRLTAEISAFYMDRNDMQLRSSAQFTDNPNDFIYITSNAKGHSSGFEAVVNWGLSDMWTLHGNLGLLSSEVTAYPLEREADISGEIIGREFAHAPRYSANVGLSFQSAENDAGQWVARLDVSTLGSFYFDYSHDEKSASRQLVNFKLGKKWEQWEIYGWVRNLFDEDYHSRGFSFGLAPPYFERSRFTRLGDARHFGVTVNYQY